MLLTGVIAALPVEFNPLNYMQRKRIATEVLKLNFDTSIPEVQYLKSGSTLNGKFSHLLKIPHNGHCFLNEISFLLTVSQMQHNNICQQLCDFIEREENYSKLRAFLGNYKSGTNYVPASKMQ